MVGGDVEGTLTIDQVRNRLIDSAADPGSAKTVDDV